MYLVPLKISNCFFDVCAKRVEHSEECFIEARDIQDYVASECRLEPKKATIQLGASVNIVKGCKAQKMFEYLESSDILVDFKLGIMEKSGWDPLAECRDFYLEVTSSPYPGHIGKCLWSPAASLWRSMEDLKIGNCIFHYLTSKSPSMYKEVVIGVSSVKHGCIELSKEELVKRLRGMDVWSKEYEDFASKWLKEYDRFYFVELSNYIEFQRAIPLNELEKLTGLTPVELQRYLVKLKLDQARQLLEKALGLVPRRQPAYTLRGLAEKATALGDQAFIILLNLLSGKNVLLVGPPGSGKTSLIRTLLEKLGVGYRLETGNPEWTPFDTIGGYLPGREVRRGFIFSAVEESVKRLEEGGLYWLIIDEVNRANVDLAFGKFFTLLDPVHRGREPLEIPGCGEGGEECVVWVPFSFRVLATMNNYDRALLFKLGYALTRRFSIISHTYLQRLPEYCGEYHKVTSEGRMVEALAKRSEVAIGALGVDYERLREELVMCSSKIPHDCIAPVDFVEEVSRYGDKWAEELYSIEASGSRIRLDKALLGIVEKVNRELAEFRDCEVCPVQVTPGVVADALKYLAVGLYAYKAGLEPLPCIGSGAAGGGGERVLTYVLLLLDTALSTYIIPQLDVLADYASRERLYRGRPEVRERYERRALTDILGEVKRKLKDYGLAYSAELVEKIEKGYHVF